MILQTGCRAIYAGREWDIYGFETDQEGYLNVVLIDPDYDAQSGTPDPTVYVRDLSGISLVESA